MYRTDEMSYPNIAGMVRHHLPSLPTTQAATWDAFQANSTLPSSRAREALQWESGPQIRFGTSIPAPLCGRFLVGSNPRSAAIWISSDAGRQIEGDWGRWEARVRAEALVLHELTHWCDWSQDGTLLATETGEAFERQAYGGFRPVYLSYRLVSYPASLRWQAPPQAAQP